MLSLLTHSYFVAFGIPTIFLLAGSAGKKLVRGQRGWEQADFFLGTELTLGVMSAALIEIFDLLKKVPTNAGAWPSGLPQQIGGSAGFLAVSFFAFIWVLSTHQDWHQIEPSEKGKQCLWLAYVCNFVGAALMFFFVLAVKGA